MNKRTGIGEILRTEREKSGRTLSEIALQTYIAESYLEALEAEDDSVFPGSIYLKGCLRNYGNFLGLSGISLVERWSAVYGDRRLQMTGRRRGTVRVKSRREKTQVKRLRTGDGRRSWTYLEWGIIVMLIAAVAGVCAWLFRS